jgi:hypothetical protein
MSQNAMVKTIITDTLIYSAVDSLKKRELYFKSVPANAVANSVHNLFLKNFVAGKLAGLIGVLDSQSANVVEMYTSRLLALYGAKMLVGNMGDKAEPGEIKASLGKLAQKQLMYSLALYLVDSANNQILQPSTGKTIGPTRA